MKGDFSRQTFDPRKHYAGVLMQQGRVQLDADWNEQAAIGRYRNETEAADVIGACGAPVHAAGFEITTDGAMLFIGPGRYYVDGLLAENDLGGLAYDDQAKFDLPGADFQAVRALLAEKGLRYALVYLDVWQRHITPLDDRRLREVALGGPDTAHRIRTVWQVKLLPVAGGGDGAARRDELLKELADLTAALAAGEEPLKQLDAQVEELKARLAALSPSDPRRAKVQQQLEKLAGRQAQAQQERAALAAQVEKLQAALDALPLPRPPACDADFVEWEALHRPSGLLNARAAPVDPAAEPCDLPAGAGYTRLENQLYRVEVHRPGALGAATFKWSRDNGVVVAAIEKIDGSSVTVDSLGPDEVLGFANGQWVELTDDALELNGQPGQLALIVDVKPATRELVLSPAPDKLAPAVAAGVAPELHPKLRRWDQVDRPLARADEQGIVTSAAWLPLEDGVEVQFSLPDPGGVSRTGDNRLIPARTATGDLEWPPYEVPNAAPQPQPPLGIEHHRCRLALIAVEDGKVEVAADCRRLFSPITETPAARQALHVAGINWDNDGFLPYEVFLKDGLRIRLDAPPDPASVSNDSLLVTLDYPFAADNQPAPNVRQRLVLLGEVGIDPDDPQTIIWRFREGADGGTGAAGIAAATSAANIGALKLAPRDAAARAGQAAIYRVNVTLRGRFIWQDAAAGRLYLDGQALGRPVVIVGGDGSVRTDLLLPSGDGARASDFESWFTIGIGQAQVDTLKVKAVVFRSLVPGHESRTVLTIDSLPLDPAKAPQFRSGDRVNNIQVFFTRPIQPEGEFAIGKPQNLLLEKMSAGVGMGRCVGEVTIKGDLLEFVAEDPPALTAPIAYRLTVFAEQTDFGPGITAQDDNSPLDGDYDNRPGTNFVLPFEAVG